MTIERADVKVIRKPWGSTDLQPWSNIHDDDGAIGELWFERPGARAPPPALLLKLLFTTQPLSIQVHPDDSFARSIGLDRGKTEAWCVLAATDNAEVAVGLKQRIERPQLRTAIDDGSIADLIHWWRVKKHDVISVPAGTIHAIGAGLVIAEIQQRSDATFRMFDHGRDRTLHVDNALAVSTLVPTLNPLTIAEPTSDVRTLLIAGPYFVLERIDLPRNSRWTLETKLETWVLAVGGNGRLGSMDIVAGDAVFSEADRSNLDVGDGGLQLLVASADTVTDPRMLRRADTAMPAMLIEIAPALH